APARRQHGIPRGGDEAPMIVGMLPALGGGLRALAATGQARRLVEGYFRPYVAALGRVDYFSYAPERLADFTRDPVLLERVRTPVRVAGGADPQRRRHGCVRPGVGPRARRTTAAGRVRRPAIAREEPADAGRCGGAAARPRASRTGRRRPRGGAAARAGAR